ncbi:FHA domain-containing protein [Solirubrobacter ginsenosidimutans]|uniref:FHA domain-containing protein n=1 Tax=Solirubrobacter ginsenosidimutans TaxID=490573 RepID=A0A9X3MXP8_9ACTN|nr:FHA domain-containing protein [Solirubrobacter ginsenosidimutans]MDA0164644.1 FHA domain-containing protein [Solirubrobacter ginsenosidimutans]
MHDWPDRHASTPSELQDRLAAERSDAPFVELRDGDGVQRLVTLTEGLTVGRSPACGIALIWDAQVSRSHASIEAVDGVWTVLDDGRSTNGTFVNEERVQGRRTLRHLDVIRVGATRLRFHDPSATTDSKLTEVAAQAVVPTLTPAQLRVLVALCRPAGGPASNEEIADELTVSIDTVKTHMRALFDAFSLQASAPYKKRFELVRLAVDAGMVSPPDGRR